MEEVGVGGERWLRQRSRRWTPTLGRPDTAAGNAAFTSSRKQQQQASTAGTYRGRTEALFGGTLLFYAVVGLGCLVADWRLPSTAIDWPPGAPVFSAERARRYLVGLTAPGPRIVGSYENEVLAVDFLRRELDHIGRRANAKRWRLDVEVQKPTGSFNLLFQDGFTSYYARVKNVLVRLEPRSGANHSLLVNCHYDTAPGSPGASDDAVSCAIMLETLSLLAQSDVELRHSIVFNFNGAEENILQAAHGFITQHPWADKVRAFVNLEACGSGGREIVFQAGPENPWLLEAYAKNVPHPFASVLGQEIFASGIIPGDTDYRIYRDYGHIPGLDIAYIRNGYIYHTRYDTQEYIPTGTIQRAGENVLALVTHLASSDVLPDPGASRHGNVVFFDFLGLHMFIYSESTGTRCNLFTAALAIVMFLISVIRSRKAGFGIATYLLNVGVAMIVILTSWVCSLVAVEMVASAIDTIGATMSWYTNTYWVIGLYAVPTLFTLVIVQRIFADTQKKCLFPSCVVEHQHFAEEIYFEAHRILLTVLLLTLVAFACRSAFLVSICILFPSVVRFVGPNLVHSLKVSSVRYLVVWLLGQLLPAIVTMYAAMIVLYIFLPIMGRAGANINPDRFVGILTGASTIFILNSLICIIHSTRSVRKLLLGLFCAFVASLVAVTFTSLGFPYSSNPMHPTPQRYMILHVDRKFNDHKGDVRHQDAGIWIMPMDYNGPWSIYNHVPELRGIQRVDCQTELYCGMPYYFPVVSRLGNTYFIPTNERPKFHIPLRFKLVAQKMVSPDTRRLTFNLTGPSHMGAILSPSLSSQLVNWSFADGVPSSGPLWRSRPTYFIYYSHGEDPGPWSFWIDIKIFAGHPRNESFLTLALSSHNLHGPDKLSPRLTAFLDQFPSWTFAEGWTASFELLEYRL